MIHIRRTRPFVAAIAIAIAAIALAATGCTDEDPTENFVGSYRTTITVSGSGSQTLTDSVTISAGETTDLIVQSQALGQLRSTIIGDTSFSIDQQQIMLTGDGGQAFSVTVSGQGSVSDGVLAASGTVSSESGSLSFTMNGSRL